MSIKITDLVPGKIYSWIEDIPEDLELFGQPEPWLLLSIKETDEGGWRLNILRENYIDTVWEDGNYEFEEI